MMKTDGNCNAQCWELEVTCKNKKYLNAVVKAVLSFGMMNFEVEIVECHSNSDNWEGSYTVLIWCSWFRNLSKLSKKLHKIEKKYEKL